MNRVYWPRAQAVSFSDDLRFNRLIAVGFVMGILCALFSVGCAGCRYSKTHERPRWMGDVNINRVEPSPHIHATEQGVPEAPQLPPGLPAAVAGETTSVQEVTSASVPPPPPPFESPTTPAQATPPLNSNIPGVAPVLPNRANERRVNIADYKLCGYIWNEMGQCSIEYEFPAGDFEERFQVLPGTCPEQFSGLALGQEIQTQMLVTYYTGYGNQAVTNEEAVAVRHTVDDDGYPICEYWRVVAGVRLAPGLRSPKLRALGGRTYSLNFTQTGASGRQPYIGEYNLGVDFDHPFPYYKGLKTDWSIVAQTCHVRR